MILLLVFAVLAGAGTALSPCVLPVLPALLSASGVGGRRRPLGIVMGLSLTFAITIIGVAKVVDGVGLGTDPLRLVAVTVLLAFGAVLIVPALAARVEAPLSRLARLGPRTRGEGLRSGLLVGAALGFVYTPCAGPILAAVISVGAASGRSVAVAIAYTLGSAVVLFALSLGGRALLERVRRAGRGPALQRVLGTVMALTAIAILTGLDVRFDQFVARHIPDVNAAAALERSALVRHRLTTITGGSARFATAQGAPDAGVPEHAVALRDFGPAPPFTDTQRWFNTPGQRPLTLAGLRGRVVLVDFWTYTCINCLRTLPYLRAWDARYRTSGLTVVGVHTPEFAFEHDAGNVASAIGQFAIGYPVVQDNNYGTWNAYGNQYWPADYLLDSAGHVRYVAFGEGGYAATEAAIRALLAQAGHVPAGAARPSGVVVPSQQATPETYLGTARAQGWPRGEPRAGIHNYNLPNGALPLNGFALGGTWSINAEAATAVTRARIDAEVQARNVYLVLSSSGGRRRPVRVLLDGQPIAARQAGGDVRAATAEVTSQRLYTLVSLPSASRHHLTLLLAPGVSGYAFTFG